MSSDTLKINNGPREQKSASLGLNKLSMGKKSSKKIGIINASSGIRAGSAKAPPKPTIKAG